MRTKVAPATRPAADNALAKKALDEIAKIDSEAKAKKLEQVAGLTAARGAIVGRIEELNHQIEQLDEAIAKVTGKPAAPTEKRQRRNLEEVRGRVVRWMETRKGVKLAAGELAREFPELDGVPVSIFLKPVITEGKIQTDTSEGAKRTKYYVAA